MTTDWLDIPKGMRLHPLRDGDLTASDIGAWLGLDRFKTPRRLYNEKTMALPPQPDNAAMQRGRWLEPGVIAAYAEKHPGHRIEPARVYLRDAKLRLGATPDAFVEDDRPFFVNAQCKVVSQPVFERDWANGPPRGYVLQTLTEGMLADARESVILAMVLTAHTADLKLYPVPRHEAAEAFLRQTVAEFWRRVEEDRPPPVDYARDADVVDAMFPRSEPETVLDLSGDNRIRSLLAERGYLKQDIAEDIARCKVIDAEIKHKLGDAERAELPGWRIVWKTVHRKESVTKAYDYRPLDITEITTEEANDDQTAAMREAAQPGAAD